MKRFHARILSAVAVAALLASSGQAWAAEKLRISLDTNPSHVRNKATELFVQELNKRAPGKFEIEVYPSGQLFRDRDVPRALRQGGVEMAIPGIWQLDGVEPNMAMPTLPVFYGLSEEATLKVMDGKVGQEINKRTEDKLRVKILGPWMNLGFQHFYSVSKPIQTHEDLKGMKIRYPGGTANAERIKALGGNPTLIPWPDVPLALSSNTVDGVSTTHESCASAKLWESGLKYAFEDRQYFGQYVPMVSQTFWGKLSPDLQKALVDSWNAIVGKQREMAAEAQKEARTEMEKNGMKVVTPSDQVLRQYREKLMGVQDQIVSEIKIDADLVKLAVAEVQKIDAGQ